MQKVAATSGSRKGGGLPTLPRISSQGSVLASTDPGPASAATQSPQSMAGPTSRRRAAALAAKALEGVEVLRVGCWSVRRLSTGDSGPIYVHMETGCVQKEPPPEVLAELASDDEDGGVGQHTHVEQEMDEELEPQEEDVFEPSGIDMPSPPCFRRIVLGSRNEMPLRMARDILAALREDTSLFDSIQQRFSDIPSEDALELPSSDGTSGDSGTSAALVPLEMEAVARVLQPGEMSDVVGTSSGMQILLRIS